MATGKNDPRNQHEKLADARTSDDQARKDRLQRPTEREAEVMRQVKDTDVEGDN